MPSKPPEPTAEAVNARVSYDPETGVFHNLIATRGHRAGDVAGNVRPDGYRRIRIAGELYYAHRLAFVVMTGGWPPAVVDHINGDPSDNRWENLRLATQAENLRNQYRPRALPKGVSWHSQRQRWRATIQVDGRQRHLGSFDSVEEAAAAYRAASRSVHGEFGRVIA